MSDPIIHRPARPMTEYERGRRAGIEEAAQIQDRAARVLDVLDLDATVTMSFRELRDRALARATAIRALADKPAQKGERDADT